MCVCKLRAAQCFILDRFNCCCTDPHYWSSNLDCLSAACRPDSEYKHKPHKIRDECEETMDHHLCMVSMKSTSTPFRGSGFTPKTLDIQRRHTCITMNGKKCNILLNERDVNRLRASRADFSGPVST